MQFTVGGRATAPRAALRMLSTTFSSNPNPSFSRTMKAAAELHSPSKTPNLPFFTNPEILNFSSQSFAQSITSPKCSYASTATSPAPISDAGRVIDGSPLVVSFYKFADFPDHADFRKPLKDLCEQLTSQIVYEATVFAFGDFGVLFLRALGKS
ncbi:hypothetical protein RJ639_009957 [Escallonia herrerae]|uniref:Uncharacterized protein n=1 Tax=Escallonia herrerae TaxID=1293975 RepID=A0AA89AXG8_9ASTE|nr:hypothetical protein RJ639_009957 [Escallonia herrerae]